MISILLNIVEINDITGNREVRMSNNILSADKFVVNGVRTTSEKMVTDKVIKLSDLLDLESVTSIAVGSRSSDENTQPLFDVNFVDEDDEPIVTTRCSHFLMAGMNGLDKNIVIDNMESEAENSVLTVFITTN